MGRRLRSAVKLMTGFSLGAAITFLTIESTLKSMELSTMQEIQATDNVTHKRTYNERSAILSSRRSSVNVMSMAMESPVISSSSGTYIEMNGGYYILTVGHAIVGPCELMRVSVNDELYDCIEYIIVNRETDYAIIEIGEIPNLTAVPVPRAIPNGDEWADEIAIQTSVFYTGYPNGMGPLTIEGRIMGHDTQENVLLHSLAWPGSSGSGVFNENGKFVGYAMAISIGMTEYGVDVLEDIVIVVPLYQINWYEIQREIEN